MTFCVCRLYSQIQVAIRIYHYLCAHSEALIQEFSGVAKGMDFEFEPPVKYFPVPKSYLWIINIAHKQCRLFAFYVQYYVFKKGISGIS